MKKAERYKLYAFYHGDRRSEGLLAIIFETKCPLARNVRVYQGTWYVRNALTNVWERTRERSVACKIRLALLHAISPATGSDPLDLKSVSERLYKNIVYRLGKPLDNMRAYTQRYEVDDEPVPNLNAVRSGKRKSSALIQR